jgi:hypothetical protein
MNGYRSIPGSHPAGPPHCEVNGVMLSGQATAKASLTVSGRQAGVTASAAGRRLADADLFPREIAGLLIVAQAELDRHVNDRGRCQACKAPFPGQRACLAEQTLGWF